MRRFAFIISLTGIFILLLVLNISKPLPVSSTEQILSLQENQKLFVTGKVISEKTYDQTKIFTLDNKIKISCKNCPLLLHKNISATGYLETYYKTPQINILKVQTKG